MLSNTKSKPFLCFPSLSERRAEEEQESERAEREALLSAIEEHKRLEAENDERIKNKNLSYQRDLDMQIDYQRRVKSKELEEEEREFRMGQVSTRNLPPASNPPL